MAFRALERAQVDPDIAATLERMQSSVVDASIAAVDDEEAGRVVMDAGYARWTQEFPSAHTEARHLYFGRRRMGTVRLMLTAGDKVNCEVELYPPETPEELRRRDPDMGHAHGKRIIQVPSIIPSRLRH